MFCIIILSAGYDGLENEKASVCVIQRLCGLSDDGCSSCHMNSTLQCLTITARLREYFIGKYILVDNSLVEGR